MDLSFDAQARTHIKTLSFTTANWSTVQSVTVFAAEDDDSDYGTAAITHNSTIAGAADGDFYDTTSSTLNVTEGDNDVCAGSTAVGGSDVTSGGLVDDCNTLLAAEATLAGTSTTALNWDAGTAMSSWTGITVVSGRVSAIELPSQTLRGMVPNNLSGLTHVSLIDFSNNELTGPIPAELGRMSRLGRLWLNGNDLVGPVPTAIGNLEILTDLRLDDNNLSGSLPSELGDLTKLTGLGLSGNSFSGPIPPEIGNLSGLTFLDLSGSGVTGSIPAELNKLTSLQTLKLNNNSLWGTIPTQFGGLSDLTWLDLGGNDLSGPIPASLGDLKSVYWLDLSNNSLTGVIPTAIGDLPDIAVLFLFNNNLSGCAPPNLIDFLQPTTLTDPVLDPQINPQKNGVVLGSCHGLVLSDTDLVVPEGDSATYTVRLATAVSRSVQVKVSSTGDSDITIDTDSVTTGDQDTVTFTTSDWSTAKTITVNAAEDDDTDNGKATIRHTLISLDADYNNIIVSMDATESDNDPLLSASRVTSSTAVLTIKNYIAIAPWYHKRISPTTSDCVAAPAYNFFRFSTTAALSNLSSRTTYVYKAYSDDECTNELTTDATHARFTTLATGPAPRPSPLPSPAPLPIDYFDDDNGNVLEGYINRLASAGITVGCNRAGNLYCPSRSVTRAEMAVFIQRALRLPTAAGPSGYDDAKGFAQGAIAALSIAGITVGCNAEGTLYCPDRPIRRDEMAAFLARARELPTPDRPAAFGDVTDNFFRNHITAIALADITFGCNASGTLFCPDDFVRRDEMAAFLVRAFLPLDDGT